MTRYLGFSLPELLVSLFLSSIIMMLVVQFYLSNKQQYLVTHEMLEADFDLQWVKGMIGNSIRRAGFTPCLAVDRLDTLDRQHLDLPVKSISLEHAPQQSIQTNRMSEVFSELIEIKSLNQILVSSNHFKVGHSVLIADCEHAEAHELVAVKNNRRGVLLTLAKPLMFSYGARAHVGEWLEERWFIKEGSLYYHLFQTEELTALVHSLRGVRNIIHGKQFITVSLGIDSKRDETFYVAVRGL